MMITTQKHPFLCFLKTEASYVVYQLHPRGWLSFLLVKACCWLSVMHFTAEIILPFPETYSLRSYCACKELLRDLLRGGLPRPHAWAQLTASRCMQVISQLRWCFGSVQEALFLPSTKVCRVTTLLLTVVGVEMYWKGGEGSSWGAIEFQRWEAERLKAQLCDGNEMGRGDR